MNPNWFIRIPFAAVFAGHGIGAVVGGVEKAPHRLLVDRLTRLAAAPVLIGAIAMVHWPRWSFVATESHPMGGMEFQVVLLGIAIWFLLGGRQRQG